MSGTELGFPAQPRVDLPTRRKRALGLGLAIALYGNAWSILDELTKLSLGGTVGGVLLGVGALGLALRNGRGGLARVGLHSGGLTTSLLFGFALGLVMGLPGLLYLLTPQFLPVRIHHETLAATEPSAIWILLLVKIPFATALAEELAFRGILQTRLREAFGPPGAVLIGSLVFTAWHLVVSLTTLLATNLGSDLLTAVLAYSLQNLAVLAAGLVWGWLREASDNLAGCVLSHWLTDVLLVGGLYFA